jgi:hypothetical protein
MDVMIHAVQVQVHAKINAVNLHSNPAQFLHQTVHLDMRLTEMEIVYHHHHWYRAHQDLLSNQEAAFQPTQEIHQLQLYAQQDNILMDMETACQIIFQLFAIQVFKVMEAEAVSHFQFLCHKSALQDILQMEQEHVYQLILN